ncbi:hypothetical protein K440DRAFT_664409 [Wilcoxina mikolae CBS 423.85]|nr:hypothetical protein K440DRAFT_664409 [Wilcoxina mikolae CBS 423.85]
MTCIVKGDSDIYGLGVRIGLYLTGLSCILARVFAPSRAGGLTSGLHVLIFALNLALIKNVMQGRPAMLELYIVLTTTQIITLMLALSGAMFSGITSAVSSTLVVISQFIITLWVCWNKRWSGLSEYDPGCARTVRFFGAVDVTGSFGTFLAVFPIVMISLAAFIFAAVSWPFFLSEKSVLRSFSEARKKLSFREQLVRSDSMALWFSQINTMLGAEEQGYKQIPRLHIHWNPSDMWDLLQLCVALALSIWFTEDTLRLSQVNVDTSLMSTGQLLPMVVGGVSVLSVFAGWLHDRMLNMVGQQIAKKKKGGQVGSNSDVMIYMNDVPAAAENNA